ncbi:hypothetical protein DSO57_1024652 [Entomophthora muscae]|uniref:Uncharacterized protein n=1 Tax=Entomophthora muscae TaxID=34485 RepID=A0ACC2TDC0_9FUNG|nr:hypothetical protein DSO57_1024652 [Entomophthora muscae]
MWRFSSWDLQNWGRRWGPEGGLGSNNRRNSKQQSQNQTKKATHFPQAANVIECITKKIKIGVVNL